MPQVRGALKSLAEIRAALRLPRWRARARLRRVKATTSPPRSPQDARVALTPRTSVRDFRDFYWLKEELERFCRVHGLPTAGGKRELADRIERFLRTGERPARASPGRSSGGGRSPKAPVLGPLSLATRAPAGFRCSQEARAFFERHLGPSFRFTVTLQRFIKDHPGVTFGEIAEEWQRQEAARKAGVRPEIAPQFEYNRFTRDFFADPRNQGKTREECLEAWRRTRARRGDHSYRPDGHVP